MNQDMREELDQASLEAKLKLWVIEHFRILPTDKRFKRLKWDQVELLFVNYISQPSDEQYRQTYIESKQKEIEEIPESSMLNMGYNEDEIKEIAKIISER